MYLRIAEPCLLCVCVLAVRLQGCLLATSGPVVVFQPAQGGHIGQGMCCLQTPLQALANHVVQASQPVEPDAGLRATLQLARTSVHAIVSGMPAAIGERLWWTFGEGSCGDAGALYHMESGGGGGVLWLSMHLWWCLSIHNIPFTCTCGV